MSTTEWECLMNLDIDAPLKKSQFVQMVPEGDKAVIWHSLFGYPKIVSSATLAFLDIFIVPRTLRAVLDKYEFDSNVEAILNELVDGYYLISEEFDEREFLSEQMKAREKSIVSGPLINYLELIMSEACNFRCLYCIHFNNIETSDRFKNPSKFMTFEIAKEAVDRYLAILRQHGKRVSEINFGGGEPLLNWPVIDKVLDYCRNTYGQDFTFKFSINTNASLITPEIARKLKEYRIEIASSLDGLLDGNDRVRLTKSGKGTFDAILQGFENLAQAGYPLDGISVTINEHNFPFLDERIIDWAAEQKMSEVRIDIDIVNMVDIPIKDVVEKLLQLRRYGKKRGIEVAGFWSRPVENLNESPIETHVAFCGAVRGNCIYVSPSGTIYGCGYSTTQLGTLAQIDSFYKKDGAYYRYVKERLTGAMEMCRGCMIEGQCGGGCNITQEFARATKFAKIKRMCEYYCLMMQELLLEQLREEFSKEIAGNDFNLTKEKGGDGNAEETTEKATV